MKIVKKTKLEIFLSSVTASIPTEKCHRDLCKIINGKVSQRIAKSILVKTLQNAEKKQFGWDYAGNLVKELLLAIAKHTK